MAWRAWRASGEAAWRPASLAREGFCHLSFAEQLAGTLERHFDPGDGLLLVELRPAALGSALRLEPSRGGEPFPHLHRPIEPGDILRETPLAHGGLGWGPLP